MPKTERCIGSGDPVSGPDEPDGTVQCFKCGRNFLPMEKRVVNGVTKFFVPSHTRTVAPKKRAVKTGRKRVQTRTTQRRSRR
jgi:hypothetical protein